MSRALNGEQGRQKNHRREFAPERNFREFHADEDNALSSAAEPIIKMASILGRAHLQCAASGLRFGYKATKRILQGQSRLLNHLRTRERSEEFGQSTLRVLVDETRGCLRDLVETSSDEVRRLQSELSGLQDATRELVNDGNGSRKTYTRRWKAKS
jgi:hypothetical protein